MKKTLLICALFLSNYLQAKNISIPYRENFESGTQGWLAVSNGLGTDWELGTPAYGLTTGAFSGNNCWDTNLNTGYDCFAEAYLYSPTFDFTGVATIQVSFWTQYSVEHLWDYMLVQYSSDGGSNWNYLPFPSLVSADGTSLKWIQSLLDVSDLAGLQDVQFRFLFSSDATITYDGFSIDDFAIETMPLGISVPNSLSSTTIYPNPGNGYFNLITSPAASDQLVIEVFDETGKPVKFTYLPQEGNAPSKISLVHPSNGNYFIRMVLGEIVEQKKLVVIN